MKLTLSSASIRIAGRGDPVNKMIKILVVVLTMIFHHNLNADCSIPKQIVIENLKLNYNDFDQDPNGGWRKLYHPDCFFELAGLIDFYHLHHFQNLLDWQNWLLYWHAGQLYADDNNYDLAIDRFSKSINSTEPADDPFKWNAYVMASIAFLKGDFQNLIKFRDELAAAQDPHRLNNLKIVQNMVICFGEPYKEVYSGNCKPNPNPQPVQ
jgi:hypothetical protein